MSCLHLHGNVLVDCVWNVMAHCDAREEKWRGNKRMEWVISHMNAEHRLARAVQTLQADVHSSPASSRLNWRPCRFKWTRPFRRKMKSGFHACAITFQMQSTPQCLFTTFRTSQIRTHHWMHYLWIRKNIALSETSAVIQFPSITTNAQCYYGTPPVLQTVMTQTSRQEHKGVVLTHNTPLSRMCLTACCNEWVLGHPPQHTPAFHKTGHLKVKH
jgi:hypothetical protein